MIETNKNHIALRLILFVFILFFATHTFAQISRGGKPKGDKYDQNSGIPYYHINAPRQLNQKKQNSSVSQYKKDAFAELVEVKTDVLEFGSYDTLNNGIVLIRMGVKAEKAHSLSMVFTPFYLAHGVTLFVYSPTTDQVKGGLNFRNNKPSGVMPIETIHNDSLIIELQVIRGVDDIGNITLDRVGVEPPKLKGLKSGTDPWYHSSEKCNVDVNCVLDSNIQLMKNSVCRLLINGSERCSGTLVNNVREDETPFILTARHCVSSQTESDATVFYFNYEEIECKGQYNEFYGSISGADLLSETPNLDFALLKLQDNIPARFKPVYAGWDANVDEVDSSYAMHHPNGDVMKVSKDTDPLEIVSYGDRIYDRYTFWQLEHYDYGTTQQGSSGCALFDAKTNRVVGTLTGGGAPCAYLIKDAYQMFSHSWDDYSYYREQLATYLDPEREGIKELDYHQPVQFEIDTQSIDKGFLVDDISVHNGWGYYSGHSSYGSEKFARHYYKNGTKYLYALHFDIAKNVLYAQSNPNASQEGIELRDSKIKFKVWDGNSAGPGELIYEQLMYMFELDSAVEFIYFDSLLVVDQHFYVGYEINYQPSDTFALNVYKIDQDSNGFLESYINDGSGWQLMNNGDSVVKTTLAISPLHFNHYKKKGNTDQEFPVDEITLYPNPVAENIQILFKNGSPGNVKIDIYNMDGKRLLSYPLKNIESNYRINLSNLERGVYRMLLIYNDKVHFKKFIKF